MFLLGFYRLYISCAIAVAAYLLLSPPVWLCVAVLAGTRTAWFFAERGARNFLVNKWFETHSPRFKEQFGPYGIRLINRAENDSAVKKSLAEVFTPSLKKLAENVRNLEAMDAIFKAGIRPDGDAWQLHDLKLKYGKQRLEQIS